MEGHLTKYCSQSTEENIMDNTREALNFQFCKYIGDHDSKCTFYSGGYQALFTYKGQCSINPFNSLNVGRSMQSTFNV